MEDAARPGDRPDPVCLVAREFWSGRTIRMGRDELLGRRKPPYPVGPHSPFFAYEASADLGCHRPLGWPLPARVLALYAEFRSRTAGLVSPPPLDEHRTRHGLLNALRWFGLDPM